MTPMSPATAFGAQPPLFSTSAPSPGDDDKEERAAPVFVPQRAPEAVKAASRRLRGGLRPAWTAVPAAAVLDHPFFLSEKWGFFDVLVQLRISKELGICPQSVLSLLRGRHLLAVAELNGDCDRCGCVELEGLIRFQLDLLRVGKETGVDINAVAAAAV